MGDANKGGISLFKKEIPLPCTLPEKIHIAGEQLEELQCLPIALPARGGAAFEAAIRFASAPTTRCCSAHLVEVRSNLRLPRHYSMRRAPAMPLFRKQSAAEVTSLAPHDSKARLISVTTCRRFMAKPCTPHPIAQRVQSFKLQTRNGGVKGRRPLRSLGGPRGPFSHVREWPPYSVQRHRRCLSLPRRARETPSPVGQIKKVQLFLKNPLDKWAPRAIMQPTSEELQTYDGEK